MSYSKLFTTWLRNTYGLKWIWYSNKLKKMIGWVK